MLTAELRARLAKVAGLANSCNPHEAQAAIGRMVALCQKEGVSLTDIIAPQPNVLAAKAAKGANPANADQPGRASYGPIPAELQHSHQLMALRLLRSNLQWSERERDFLESMRCKRSTLSERQESWLKDLKAKADAYRSKGAWQ